MRAKDMFSAMIRRIEIADREINVTEAVDAIKRAIERARLAITTACRNQAERFHQARVGLADAQRRLRELAIGMTGNPDKKIAKPDRTMDIVVMLAVAAGVLVLEFGVNLDLVHVASSGNVAMAFSAIAAIVAFVTATIAAITSKREHGYNDAIAEAKRYFLPYGGKDPKTGQKPHVFALSSIHGRINALAHAIFFGSCAMVLVIRYWIIVTEHRHFGELGGSVAFVALMLGYYLFKLQTASKYPTHELNQYFEAQAEVQALTKVIETASTPDIKEVAAKCTEDTARIRKDLNVRIEAARAARRLLARIMGEARGASKYFLKLFHDLAEQLVKTIGDRDRGFEKLPALVIKDDRGAEIESFFTAHRQRELDLTQYAEPAMPDTAFQPESMDFAAFLATEWPKALTAAAERAKKPVIEGGTQGLSNVTVEWPSDRQSGRTR